MSVRGSFRRHPVRWIATPLVVLALLLVAGPYTYIHLIQEPAPPPLSLSKASAEDVAEVRAADVDGTWGTGPGSAAGYRVDEKIAGQANTAVGRTDAVRGEVTIADGAVTEAGFEVDLTKVSSDEEARDAAVHGSILETATYPKATFALTSPIELPKGRSKVEVEATGRLAVHGETHAVTFTLEAQRTAKGLEVTGAIPITFADYGVTAPKVGPGTSVEDHGLVEFLLTLTRGAGTGGA